jgi:hypothetical protein
MERRGVASIPGEKARGKAVSQHQRFNQCMYAWRCWMSGAPVSEEILESGTIPEGPGVRSGTESGAETVPDGRAESTSPASESSGGGVAVPVDTEASVPGPGETE